jgi:hypothetical protein
MQSRVLAMTNGAWLKKQQLKDLSKGTVFIDLSLSHDHAGFQGLLMVSYIPAHVGARHSAPKPPTLHLLLFLSSS